MSTAEEKKDNWNMFVALTTAAIAVLTAITTLYMGKFSSRTILAQAQETDQWAFYQAKSIKEHTFTLQKQHFELELEAMGGRISKGLAEKYGKAISTYGATLERYVKEKQEIKDKAEALAKEKQLAQTKAGKFGFAMIFLQIAIMMNSVSVVTKKRQLWYFGLAMTIGGVFFFVDGFYLFY